MKIAIHAKDLDNKRIDGTRVYILNILNWFGKLNISDQFTIYHQDNFNPQLAPRKFSNYFEKKIYSPLLWTQTIFALNIFKDKPDVVWMPMHNTPLLKRKKTKTVVTIHDLAFKYFPQYFPKKDLRKLNTLSKIAIEKSDKIIAVSQSTKGDILKFFPEIKEEKISVVHHGFDKELFEKEIPKEFTDKVLSGYNIKAKNYILYVGAIQPRKNLEVLIAAFEKIKEKGSNIKLLIAGEKAWMWEGVIEKVAQSKFSNDIILTGSVDFENLPVLYKNASVFVFPSLYEGFGIPVLEAFSCGCPVIAANNSSLPEVGADGAIYFESKESSDLAEKITSVLESELLRNEMIERGRERLKNFSWEKCARQTLDILLK